MHHSIQPVNVLVPGSTEKNYFQLLWDKIEKYELRNQKAEKKVNDLYQEYELTVFPYQKKMANSRCEFVEHLMTFLSVKNIKPQERQRLFDYVGQWLEELHHCSIFCDLEILNKLCEKFDTYHDQFYHKEKQQALNKACSEFENMIKDMLGEDVELPHKKIREAISSNDEHDLFKLLESIQNEYQKKHPIEDSEEQDEWDDVDPEWDDFEFNYYKNEEEEASKITELFKGSQLNKIYKRIANVIHPDKEQDPLKRKEKHELMQSLVKAKKDRDVITLIKMYSQFVPDGEYHLGGEAMKHVEHLLEMKVRTLNLAHKEIFNGQGVKSHVWKNFSATSKKKIQEKMQDHNYEIGLEINRIEKDILKSDSVKRMLTFIKSQGRMVML